ncbi:amidohydrolase family protein [Pseudonocardia sichuanensis]
MPASLLDRIRDGTAPGGVGVVRRGNEEWVTHPGGFAYPLAPTFHDIEARLAGMDAAGIGTGVMSISPDLYAYEVGARDASVHAALVNDALADLVAAHPDRLAGLATLPLQEPESAVIELVRSVKDLGLRGAQIGPVIVGDWLDHPRFRPVLRAAADLRVPLVLHPYYLGPRPDFADYYLVNLVGNPLQTTTVAARLILGGVLDELPHLRFVLVHGGGFLPYQIGRLDHGWRVRPEAHGCVDPPSAYLGRFAFDTLTHSPAALRYLLDLAGDAVVYGTDTPFDMGGGSLTAQLRGLEVAPAVRAAVAGGTARRIFDLEEEHR